jgi:phosphohistidine phosphatase SixA
MKFMNGIIISLVSFLIFISPASANSKKNDETYTIYLVRHAEKVLDQKNPPLTECGIKRATQLATILEQADIKTIYSTQYTRTEQTAQPLAKKLNLAVKSYSPRDLAKFAEQVKKDKTTMVIVGHSNTTPQLAALIANTDVKDITEKEYQMLYQVHFSGENSHLTILKQPLACH